MKYLIHRTLGWRLRLARYRWYRKWQGIPETDIRLASIAREALEILAPLMMKCGQNVNRDYEQKWPTPKK